MHPDLAKWQHAKRAAYALSGAAKADVLQLPDGRKRVIVGGRVVMCETWLGVYSLLYRIRCDQIGRGR